MFFTRVVKIGEGASSTNRQFRKKSNKELHRLTQREEILVVKKLMLIVKQLHSLNLKKGTMSMLSSEVVRCRPRHTGRGIRHTGRGI